MCFDVDWKRGLFRRRLGVRALALEDMYGCEACDEIMICDTPELEYFEYFELEN